LAKASPIQLLRSLPLFQRSVVILLVLALGISGYPAETFGAQDAAPIQADTSPAALDHLLAPIALYPDALLMQVLAASVNSQEVLDAGNWLLENKSLQGTQIDDAAKKIGFSAATTALLHFPEVVDQMCTNLDWTKQVGAAFSADQAAVLASIQRLRAQAVQYGNLKTTPQQQVVTQTDNGKQVIVIQPANPQVIYVPQYNPQVVYVAAPPPSTGTVVAAAVISFGVGMAVGAMFSNNNYYPYPRWGYGGVYYRGGPYYPAHYPYRPVYGPAFRPAYGYRPPANYPYHRANYNSNYYNSYRGGNNNVNINKNNNVNINTGNNNNNNNNRPGGSNGYNKPVNGNNNNNRPGGNNSGNNGGYNKPGNGNNNNNNRPGGNNNAGNGGGYNKPGAGNNNNRPGNNGGSNAGNSRPTNASNANRPAPDRGYAKPAAGGNQSRPAAGNQSRPGGQQAQARPAPQPKPAQVQTRQAPAFSGGGQSGKSAQAASQRGAASNAGRKK
jgi:hypothetical protein